MAKRKHVQSLEQRPHDTYSDFVISEFLFGPTFASGGERDESGSVLARKMNVLGVYDSLLKWEKAEWERVLSVHFVNNFRVCLVGLPSQEASAKLQAEEEARLA